MSPSDIGEFVIGESPIGGSSYTVGSTNINFDTSGGVEMFAIPYTLPPIGINSSLQLGAFRFTDQNWSDETSSISGILIGLSGAADFELTDDWNSDTGPNVDWNVLSGQVDWGSGNQVPNAFNLTLRSSNDIYNPGIQGDESLQVWNGLGSGLTYSPLGYSGVYHSLTFNANAAGQAFAVKTLDITGLATGRMSNL